MSEGTLLAVTNKTMKISSVLKYGSKTLHTRLGKVLNAFCFLSFFFLLNWVFQNFSDLCKEECVLFTSRQKVGYFPKLCLHCI